MCTTKLSKLENKSLKVKTGEHSRNSCPPASMLKRLNNSAEFITLVVTVY